ncbi:MAG: Co2+/Mg2+ efflux protein ApaG [Rhodobiaceae bacterium]|nr:Co2+/Mg2+ efflux protein ApaG [Rhodobiaceae bacterium]MCC0014226.1 Co2+/Mg2+ efflux protein ApaG [Rhodobiaceae bacterium]MCC0017782.1 Co2+/Mg2+ efflux protein ApaG [Rhodobiaceae bacterium]MCC0061927.1 Co2+/Mg2+ efflux protein ApaG [Rhodobiaceae bacterium]
MFKAVTNGIEVSAEPAFSPERSAPDENRYFWTYTITLTNRGQAQAQLISRHWEIIDETGTRQSVDGPGVVGEQPVLAPGAHFRYTSGVPLATPSGMMSGHYRMQAGDGSLFNIDIPAFSLDSPHAIRIVN